jgi:hypothetical protein
MSTQIAHDQSAAHAASHEFVRIAAIDHQEIGIAGPDPIDQWRGCETPAQVFFFHEQGFQSAL